MENKESLKNDIGNRVMGRMILVVNKRAITGICISVSYKCKGIIIRLSIYGTCIAYMK